MVHDNFAAGVIITNGLGRSFNVIIIAEFHLSIEQIEEIIEGIAIDFNPGDLVYYIRKRSTTDCIVAFEFEGSKILVQHAQVVNIRIYVKDQDANAVVVYELKDLTAPFGTFFVYDTEVFGTLDEAIAEYEIRLEGLA